jgi:hypothetical protein
LAIENPGLSGGPVTAGVVKFQIALEDDEGEKTGEVVFCEVEPHIAQRTPDLFRSTHIILVFWAHLPTPLDGYTLPLAIEISLQAKLADIDNEWAIFVRKELQRLQSGQSDCPPRWRKQEVEKQLQIIKQLRRN